MGSPEELERRLLFRQVLKSLSAEERLICGWKRAGYSSREIADRRGTTAAAVDKMLSRARERVRGQLSLKSVERSDGGEITRSTTSRRAG
jgi:DNA-directed RNA polymerase specialized sigma24 family protein